MREYIYDACEEIDSAMFSGDAFLDKENRDGLRDYLLRWDKALRKWDETAEENQQD